MSKKTPDDILEKVIELAKKGYSAKQIAKVVGRSDTAVRKIASKANVSIRSYQRLPNTANNNNFSDILAISDEVIAARILAYAKQVKDVNPCTTRQMTEAEREEFSNIKPIDKKALFEYNCYKADSIVRASNGYTNWCRSGGRQTEVRDSSRTLMRNSGKIGENRF